LVAALRARVPRGLRLQVVVERHHPKEPHWYLEALGAVPEARGTGVGKRVVQPVLDACDDARLPAYLESSNPRNWSFYERLGFVRGQPLPVPRGCPLVMPMRREPR
jgi:GNAT superfamily N-acetyltransferase